MATFKEKLVDLSLRYELSMMSLKQLTGLMKENSLPVRSRDGKPEMIRDLVTKVQLNMPRMIRSILQQTDMDYEKRFYEPELYSLIKSSYMLGKRIGDASGFGTVSLYEDVVIKQFKLCGTHVTNNHHQELCEMSVQNQKAIVVNGIRKKTLLVPNYLAELMVSAMLNELKPYTPCFVETFGFQYAPYSKDVPSDSRGVAYQVMETLKPLQLKDEVSALWFAFEVAWALAQAHEKFRFTHFDLHDGNILSRPGGTRYYEVGDGLYIQSTMPFETVIIDYGFSRLETDSEVLVGKQTFSAGLHLQPNRHEIFNYYDFNPYLDFFSAIRTTLGDGYKLKDNILRAFFRLESGQDLDTTIRSVLLNVWRADPVKISSLDVLHKAPATPRQMVFLISVMLMKVNDPRVSFVSSVDSGSVYKLLPSTNPPYLMTKTVSVPTFDSMDDCIYKIYREAPSSSKLKDMYTKSRKIRELTRSGVYMNGTELRECPNFVNVVDMITHGDCLKLNSLTAQLINKCKQWRGFIISGVPEDSVSLGDYLKRLVSEPDSVLTSDYKFFVVIYNLLVFALYMLVTYNFTVELNNIIVKVHDKVNVYSYTISSTVYEIHTDVTPIFTNPDSFYDIKIAERFANDYARFLSSCLSIPRRKGPFTDMLETTKFNNLMSYLRNLRLEYERLIDEHSIRRPLQPDTNETYEEGHMFTPTAWEMYQTLDESERSRFWMSFKMSFKTTEDENAIIYPWGIEVYVPEESQKKTSAIGDSLEELVQLVIENPREYNFNQGHVVYMGMRIPYHRDAEVIDRLNSKIEDMDDEIPRNQLKAIKEIVERYEDEGEVDADNLSILQVLYETERKHIFTPTAWEMYQVLTVLQRKQLWSETTVGKLVTPKAMSHRKNKELQALLSSKISQLREDLLAGKKVDFSNGSLIYRGRSPMTYFLDVDIESVIELLSMAGSDRIAKILETDYFSEGFVKILSETPDRYYDYFEKHGTLPTMLQILEVK